MGGECSTHEEVKFAQLYGRKTSRERTTWNIKK